MKVSNNVKILSLAFLFIFFGYNGVQQYLTIYFLEAKLFKAGFNSLVLIYLFFVLSNLLAAVFVSKYGAKKCLIFSSLFYSMFIFSLLTPSIFLIYIISALLGMASSFLWTAQNSYLIRASDEKSYGENAGFFSVLQSLGSALGIFVLGFLIAKFSYKIPFLTFASFPLIGFLLFFKLKDLKTEKVFSRFQLLKKTILSKTALRLSSIWFGLNFIFGLVIGIIPIQIKESLGVSFVGILSSLFFILPITLSYFFGKLSDVKGRKQMIIISYALLIVGLLSLFFSGQSMLLVFGIILLALNWTIIKPITYALVGDVSTKENLEFLTAFLFMVQNIGVILALLISSQFQIKTIYLISIATTIISFFVAWPLLRLKLKNLREKISQEIS
ncbi:MFS transporter [Patescibacteria group bacterium]|nr:MFS transporter [Patescibacteria group bacterium]MBU4481776.1 MFS transporter [Patescibacteria group bacterium]